MRAAGDGRPCRVATDPAGACGPASKRPNVQRGPLALRLRYRGRMTRAALGLLPLSLLALALALLSAGCALEPGGEADEAPPALGESDHAIVNGTVTAEFPGTGMLIVGDSPDLGMIGCSVTLIGCDTVLTAAHCVCEGFGAQCPNGPTSEPLHVFFQNAGFFRVASVATHPDYNEYIEHDLAILRLAEPVTGVRPVPVASAPVGTGEPATIVGFGRTGGEVYEYGIKRRGEVVTTSCSPDLGQQKLCWKFDGGASSSPSNVCHGDSGGSTYAIRDGVPELVGVHSTTNQMSCLESPGTYESADAAVWDHMSFITASAGGGLAQSVCGDLPQVGQQGADVLTESGAVELGGAAASTIEVPRGTAELRIALNSTDGAGANLDLYLRHGEPATPSMYDCAAGAASAHGFCVVPSPEPGTWHVQVVAHAGASSRGGEYQMTATILSGAPVGADDAYAVGAGEPFAVAAAEGVLVNDQGTARGALSARIETPPAHGQLELAADGSFRYVPEDGFTGTDSFTYLADDGSYQGLAAVTLTVGLDDSGMTGGCAAGGRGGSPAALLLLAAAALLARRRRRTAA